MSNSFNAIKATLGKNFDVQQYFTLIDTQSFTNEIRKDMELISKNQLDPNSLFEEHAAYILRLNFEQKHKVGLQMWLSLLDKIKDADSQMYESMHKGTVFYHTGIMYLLNDRWLEGIEWLDYAFEQDTRGRNGIIELPATWILSFDQRLGSQRRANDFGVSSKMERELTLLIDQINILDQNVHLNIIDFRNKIKTIFLDASINRPIRAAWCTLLANIMVKAQTMQYLRLGPHERCVQVTAHKSFVDLTLVLETLIAHKYIGPNAAQTLGKMLCNFIGPQLFNNNQVYNRASRRIEIIPEQLRHDYTTILADIHSAEKLNDKLKVAYQLVYEVRNHSHHLFNEEQITESTFDAVFLRLCYAIVVTIQKIY